MTGTIRTAKVSDDQDQHPNPGVSAQRAAVEAALVEGHRWLSRYLPSHPGAAGTVCFKTESRVPISLRYAHNSPSEGLGPVRPPMAGGLIA